MTGVQAQLKVPTLRCGADGEAVEVHEVAHRHLVRVAAGEDPCHRQSVPGEPGEHHALAPIEASALMPATPPSHFSCGSMPALSTRSIDAGCSMPSSAVCTLCRYRVFGPHRSSRTGRPTRPPAPRRRGRRRRWPSRSVVAVDEVGVLAAAAMGVEVEHEHGVGRRHRAPGGHGEPVHRAVPPARRCTGRGAGRSTASRRRCGVRARAVQRGGDHAAGTGTHRSGRGPRPTRGGRCWRDRVADPVSTASTYPGACTLVRCSRVRRFGHHQALAAGEDALYRLRLAGGVEGDLGVAVERAVVTVVLSQTEVPSEASPRSAGAGGAGAALAPGEGSGHRR